MKRLNNIVNKLQPTFDGLAENVNSFSSKASAAARDETNENHPLSRPQLSEELSNATMILSAQQETIAQLKEALEALKGEKANVETELNDTKKLLAKAVQGTIKVSGSSQNEKDSENVTKSLTNKLNAYKFINALKRVRIDRLEGEKSGMMEDILSLTSRLQESKDLVAALSNNSGARAKPSNATTNEIPSDDMPTGTEPSSAESVKSDEKSNAPVPSALVDKMETLSLENRSLSNKLADAYDQIHQLEKEKMDTWKQMSTLTSQKKRSEEEAEKELFNLRNYNTNAKSEIESLKRKVEMIGEELEQRKVTMEKVIMEKGFISNELEVLQEELNNTGRSKEELKKDVSNLRSAMELLKIEKQEYESKATDLESQVDTVKIERLLEHQELDKRFIAKENELADAISKTKTLYIETVALNGKINTLLEENKQIWLLLQDAQAEVKQLKTQRDSASSEVQELLEMKQKSGLEFMQHTEQFNSHITALTAETERLKLDLAAAQAQLQEEKQSDETFKIAELERKYRDAAAQVTQLESEKVVALSKMQDMKNEHVVAIVKMNEKLNLLEAESHQAHSNIQTLEKINRSLTVDREELTIANGELKEAASELAAKVSNLREMMEANSSQVSSQLALLESSRDELISQVEILSEEREWLRSQIDISNKKLEELSYVKPDLTGALQAQVEETKYLKRMLFESRLMTDVERERRRLTNSSWKLHLQKMIREEEPSDVSVFLNE